MTDDLERVELRILFEAMYHRYGYDFRNYAYASTRRRIHKHIKKNNFANIAELQHHVLHNEHAVDALLIDLSINITEMFRDPPFFKALRKQVLPEYRDEDHLKIWHAGCSSGEEAYSMAIILKELKMLDNSQLYATDFNNEILNKAKKGIIDIKKMRAHIKNYQRSDGAEDFADYYTAKDNGAILSQTLKNKIIFSNHNLAADSVFGEMQIIVCRNVLIYFDTKLQNRVFKLFVDSLADNGILCLGSHETLRISKFAQNFETISETQRIYRKI